MQLTGHVHKIHELIARGTFQSRKVWITIYDPSYPQTVEIQCSQAKAGIFDNIKPGTEVTCEINLRGKVTTWQGVERCFTSLECWKVTVGGKKPAAMPPSKEQAYKEVREKQDAVSGQAGNVQGDYEDDLPF